VSEQRKYGVLLTAAKAIQFTLYQIDGVDIEPAATFATGDIKISKDGAAEVNTTNLPTDEGQGYSLILTLAELQARRIRLFIVDQTATKVWLDIDINIETYGHASAMHAFDLNDNVRPDLDAIAIALTIMAGADGVRLATLQALYAPSKAGDDMGLTAVATSAQLIADIFNEVLDKATYNVGQSLAKIVRELGSWNSAEGAVTGTPTTTVIATNITGYDTNFFRDQGFWAYNGAAQAGQSRIVTTYNTDGTFTFDEPFTTALISGDDVVVATPHVHGISELSESVRTEMDSNSTQLAAIVADTNELQADDIPGLITALNDPTAAAVAAAVASYDMGNGRTIEEALAFLRNKWTIIGGTLTVYDTDDTTILWTSAMTQTAGDPVSASDPV